jgi:peptide/nickel transport system substrate-binding protein
MDPQLSPHGSEASSVEQQNARIDRRQFLRRAALVSVAGMVGSSTLLAACQAAPPAAAPTAAPAAAPPPAATSAPQAKVTAPTPATAPAQVATPAQAAAAPTAAGRTGSAIERLNVAAGIAIPHLDWQAVLGASAIYTNFTAHIYDALFAYDTSVRKFMPSLAESYELSSDGRRLKVNLRKGVTFHDGSSLTAEDVKFSYDRYIGFSPGYPAGLFIESTRVVDPSTVEFDLKFVQRLGWEYRFNTRIYPKAAFERLGDKGFAERPIGSGPYKVTDFALNNSIALEANPNYWRDKPLAKNVVVKLVQDPVARQNLLRSGEVDLIDQLPIDAAKGLESQYDVTSVPSLQILQFRFNTRVFPESPWKDVRVRQAANYAVDKDTIAKEIYGGRADVVPGAASRAWPSFDPALQPYPYDPDKAKSLLQQAGLPNGFEFNLAYPTERYAGGVESAQATISYLGKVGLVAKSEGLPGATFGPRYINRDPTQTLDVALGNFLSYSGDAQQTYATSVHSRTAVSGFVDPTLDQMIDSLDPISDEAQRTETLRQIDRYLHDQARYLMLYEIPEVWAVKKNIAWNPQPGWPVLELAKVGAK